MKKKVLIVADYYIPSVKGGGPIKSIKNLIDNLSDRLEFYLVTSDRDLGDDQPFDNIITDEWLTVGKANVLYTNPTTLTWKKISKIINSIDYEVMYLNSFFSYRFSIIPILLKKLKKISNKPIVIAPRGQFSSGALGLKSEKKRIFISTAKALGLYNHVIWHATADTEKRDIASVFGKYVNVKVANNLTANYKQFQYDKDIQKSVGTLKIVFISRVHPKKNLKKAIKILKDIRGDIEFNIFGPIEDKFYWYECQDVIKTLPSNVRVSYKGILEHENILNAFKAHHVFLFPTLGENFGHVISEALIGGCPVIISDQTPWNDIENSQAGWKIELSDNKRFTEVLQYCVNLNEGDYKKLSKKAFNYGKETSNKDIDINNTFNLFD